APLVMSALREAGAAPELRAAGAGFVVLETFDGARERGARILGEIAGAAWRAVPARPHRIGSTASSRAIAAALTEAGASAAEVGRVYTSANGDGPREEWERALVDDGSRDGSADVARRAGADVIRHPRRLGKGEAIRTGVAAAQARGASIVVTLDGDGQHSPAELGALLDAARAMPRAIVVGVRRGECGGLPPDRLNAMRVAGFFVNWACGLRLDDTQSGFRAYPIELFDHVQPRHGGFVFETEVLVAGVARGWPVHEVPVTAIP